MRILLPLVVLAAVPCIAGTIVSGSASYTTGALPTAQTGIAPTADFRPLGGTTTDHLARNWWYYRVGVERERPFGNYNKPNGAGSISTTENSSGNTSIFNITELGAGSATRFTAVLAYTLSSGPSGTWTLLEMSLRINNPTAAPLTASFFNYLDANVQDTATNDTASLSAPNVIRITDPSALELYHTSYSANAFQVSAANALRNSLVNNSVTNLNNTGLPFAAGNYTGAWQWNVVVPAGGTYVIDSAFGTLVPMETPEPSTFALCLTGAIAALTWRRVRTSP